MKQFYPQEDVDSGTGDQKGRYTKRIGNILSASGLMVLGSFAAQLGADPNAPDTDRHSFGHRRDHRSCQARREHQDARWQVRDDRRAPCCEAVR